MDNVLKIEKEEITVKTKTEKYYISEDFFYEELRKAGIGFSVNWESDHAFKYYRIGESKNVHLYEVERLICNIIGIIGKLIISTYVKEDNEGISTQYVSKIYILKETKDVLDHIVS